MRGIVVAAIAAFAFASSAQAVSYFSVGAVRDGAGSWRDPGVATYEQTVAAFDGGDYVGYDVDHSAGFAFSRGTDAPAGDTTRFMTVEAGGSVLFDLRNYLDSRGLAALNVSVYLGSIDASNSIDVLGRSIAGGLNLATPLKTITGAALTQGLDSSLSSTANRRLYINFAASEQIGALRFSSVDAAFQFDTISVSSVHYVINPQRTLMNFRPNATGPGTLLTPATSLLAAPLPEPASWATMLAGFGLLGGLLRRQRRGSVALA